MFTSYLIHFEFISVTDLREASTCIPLHVNIQFSQHYLLSIFPTEYSWLPYQMLVDWITHGFISELLLLFYWSVSLCFMQGSLLSLTTRNAPGGLLLSQLCKSRNKNAFQHPLKTMRKVTLLQGRECEKEKKTSIL